MKIDLDNVAYVGETSVTIRQSRRRITIPKEIVDKLDIHDGDKVRWILFNDGKQKSPVKLRKSRYGNSLVTKKHYTCST